VDLPDIKGRTEILRVHSKKVPLSPDVNLELIARGTPGFSGADLANIVNEAALVAAGKNKKSIEMNDFETAKDKLVLGKEKKSRVIPEEEKRMTSFHEIGHVLTSILLDKTEPVHKVSIIPRGFTGGATHYLLSDKSGYSKSYLDQILVTLMGGRAAEEIMFGEITTGAGNDIERCTDIAKKMVCVWGMSEKIGPMTIGKDQGEVYLGKDILSRDIYSDDTAKMVDIEIRNLIHESHAKAIEILKGHKDLMEILAKRLLEVETLGTEEIFDTVLSHVSDEYKPLVEKKYQQAMEMRFEYAAKPSESEPEDQPEVIQEQPKPEQSETPDKEDNDKV
jgi:cell division protease FtsH